jgi:hypothetical protein
VSAALLWLLLALFVLRVVGQVVVALAGPPWLPDMKQWYSGLIPYPVLLPIQLVFVAVMAAIARDVGRGAGVFAGAGPALGRFLIGVAIVYAAAMGVRYLRWRRTPPEHRRAWIPIVFHVVLATFVAVYGEWLAR